MNEAVHDSVSDDASTEKRERSSIEFPYMGLDEAIEVAQAIHRTTGSGACQTDQLAAALGLSMASSGFRVRLGTTKMFGLIESERGSGAVRLTDLGHRIVDSTQERQAKIQAFLNVPLYNKLVEIHRGKTLPPAAALERVMGGLGVAKKQTDRARQTFERSAQSAGFFEYGRDKLVAPALSGGGGTVDAGAWQGGVASVPAVSFGGTVSAGTGTSVGSGSASGVAASGGAGGGGSFGGLTGDPLIDAMVRKLPAAGSEWKRAERDTWLTMINMAFDLAYGVEPKAS